MGVSLRTMVLAAALSTFAATGCADLPGDSSAAISVAPVTEQWTLSYVDAWRPPMSIEAQPGVSREILSGAMRFDFGGTWTLTINHRDTSADLDRAGTLTVTGRYARNANTIALLEDGTGAMRAATLNDDGTLDVPMGGHHYLFVVTP